MYLKDSAVGRSLNDFLNHKVGQMLKKRIKHDLYWQSVQYGLSPM